MIRTTTKTILLSMALLASAGALNIATSTPAKAEGYNSNLLLNYVGGKFELSGSVGYIYSFASNWVRAQDGQDSTDKSTAASSFGYGGSLGYIHRSGWGLTTDYLRFEHKWLSATTDGNNYDYKEAYNIITFTPSYRLNLDSFNHLGLRVGLGLGFNVATKDWSPTESSNGGTSGSAKGTGGFIFAPEVALEYDYSLLHIDIKARYLHQVADMSYNSTTDHENSKSGEPAPRSTLTYTARSGPLAVFVGGSLGMNF
ncbi:MAG: hypothetical protein QM529_06585 [Hydrotalea sp.]|nr:hypothetical protein [Hydrotalea sp.]